MVSCWFTAFAQASTANVSQPPSLTTDHQRLPATLDHHRSAFFRLMHRIETKIHQLLQPTCLMVDSKIPKNMMPMTSTIITTMVSTSVAGVCPGRG